MRHLLCALFLVVPTSYLAAADAPTLAEARQRWLKGNYDEARGRYEELIKDAKVKSPASIGLSRVLQTIGEYDKALEAIDAALKDDAKNPDLVARRAELLYLRGDWDEALKTAEAALAVNEDHFLARWIRAKVYWDQADFDKADAEFRWFVKKYVELDQNDKPIKDPDTLLLVGLAGVENARWHSLPDQYHFVLKEVYGPKGKDTGETSALEIEKEFWYAELSAGRLLMEAHNPGEARGAFEKALVINPSAAEAMVGKGQAALDKFEMKEAETQAERALKVNPRLPEALRLRADIYLISGDWPSAMRELETAQKVNPRDEDTLGRIGACLYLQHKEGEFKKLADAVAKFDPKPGVFNLRLAEVLDNRRWFGDAEKFYRKSAELRPMLPWADNELGLLYMRLGREPEARDLLKKAFKKDSFNVRVSNTLQVLKHLDSYSTLKTAHFELRYDPKNDEALAKYMGEYLEGVYDDLAKKFDYRPKGPILVEVFNNHEMFSGRVVALPDLHTIGACTGAMFAMVSPSGKGIRKPFNWGRVLRHEMTHIFNLEQTNFLVPHWFTEGLAVMNEGFPRPQIWNQLLVERVPAGDVLNLDNIDLAFIRPKSQLDWNMAYCQAQLYVQYLREKYPDYSDGKLLAAFRDGLDTGSALSKICKVDKATFEKGYLDYLKGEVQKIKGKPVAKAKALKELKDELAAHPDDPDLCAQVAEKLVKTDKVEARKLADKALAAKDKHQLASVVKAKLLLAGGDADGAKQLLDAALDKKNPEPKLLLELGNLYYEASDFPKATEMYELGQEAEPYDSEWLTRLARVHAQTNDKEKQIAVLIKLVPMDADDLEHRKRLARLLSESGKPAEAEKYARESLEIDIRDKEARELLLKALTDQKKDAEAEKIRGLPEK
jgi:cellulose synthase operon protein C